jgi:uncharacterized protein YceK
LAAILKLKCLLEEAVPDQTFIFMIVILYFLLGCSSVASSTQSMERWSVNAQKPVINYPINTRNGTNIISQP